MSINIVNLIFNRLTQEEEAKVLWEWESKPFGESPTNEDVDQDNTKFSLNLRFPGQYFDSETQTHYNINRDYNPVTGRYIQSDPIGFDGGYNTFGYVNGNPILFKDLEGNILYFDGYFGTSAVIGFGGTASLGSWTDDETNTGGKFYSYGLAWGLDTSIGYFNGKIFATNAKEKFKGLSNTLAGGIGDFGYAEIYDTSNNVIGELWSVDGSPYLASFTFTRSKTSLYDEYSTLDEDDSSWWPF